MKYLALFLFMACLPVVAAPTPSVTELKKGEKLEVIFNSSGCFHSSELKFDFHGKEVTISQVKSERAKNSPEPEQTEYESLGTLKLSKDQITKIDALFDFYAGKPDGGCTTVDQIGVSLLRGDKTVWALVFTDGSCTTYDMKNVLTFGALERLIRAQLRQKAEG